MTPFDTLAKMILSCYFTDEFELDAFANQYDSIFPVYLPQLDVTVQVRRTKAGYYWPIYD